MEAIFSEKLIQKSAEGESSHTPQGGIDMKPILVGGTYTIIAGVCAGIAGTVIYANSIENTVILKADKDTYIATPFENILEGGDIMLARIKILGIKCDNPKCDFIDPSAKFTDYKKWLNKPCPKCGANLLTLKDLEAIKRLVVVTHFFNRLLRPFIKISRNDKYVRIPVEMYGTGRMTFLPGMGKRAES